MGQVVPFPNADDAWESYRRLADQALADNRLFADRAHCQAMILAHEKFKRAFLASEKA